jgi:hypothetical protein
MRRLFSGQIMMVKPGRKLVLVKALTEFPSNDGDKPHAHRVGQPNA